MNYIFKITKTVPNPEFDKQLAEFEQNNRTRYFNNRNEMRNEPGYPASDVIKDVLLVELTEDEYKKIKAEVLKAFE